MSDVISRREALISGSAILAAAAAVRAGTSVQPEGQGGHPAPTRPTATPHAGAGYLPVVTPNGSTLPFTMDGGVKVFHLVAEPTRQELTEGVVFNVWGYNGSTPGPTIEAVEGDRVRILVTNKLPAPTSVHWHGLILPNGMDGASGLTQPAIPPGETFRYEFDLVRHGTFMYHPHFDEMTQMGLGLMGFFIIHPKSPESPAADRDYAIFLHEWAVAPGASTPDPNVMLDFNYFTFNGRAFPGTAPLVARVGDLVRIRLANVSMDNHPIHLHGTFFHVTGTDGGRIPESARWPTTTVDVPPGSTREIEFVAAYPGDWPFHCHKTHHTMNGMAHGLPNLIGVDQTGVDEEIRELAPGYMAMGESGMAGMHMKGPRNHAGMGRLKGPFGWIEMGGMFTILKVREHLDDQSDPGWYAHPEGTVASPDPG